MCIRDSPRTADDEPLAVAPVCRSVRWLDRWQPLASYWIKCIGRSTFVESSRRVGRVSCVDGTGTCRTRVYTHACTRRVCRQRQMVVALLVGHKMRLRTASHTLCTKTYPYIIHGYFVASLPYILTEPVPYRFVSVNRRNNETRTHTATRRWSEITSVLLLLHFRHAINTTTAFIMSSAPSLSILRQRLKTFLFSRSYSDIVI